jgi:homoserine kinase
MIRRVTVKVPATSANMGPGFDCLGMALDIWNTVHVEVGTSGFVIRGEGEGDLRRGRSNLVYRVFGLPFKESGKEVPKVSFTCENEIPLGRGLGSSSAAVVAGLVAGNEVCGRPLSQEALLELAARVEGHPDNVSPALLGGCQIVVRDGDRLITSAVPMPDELRAVVFVPDVPMPTKQARALLPREVTRQDAVYNIGRVGLLVSALATGDFTHLAVATEDRLHQPARQAIFPVMKNIFRAALGAGALGVFLSGAGSSVLALTRGKEITVGYEMADAAAKSGVGGTLKITRPTSRGAHLVEGG